MGEGSQAIPSPSVAFLVASYNAASTLPFCLKGIYRQQPAQVVVVDDGSTDDTRALAVDWPQVEWVHLPLNQGVAVARNEGLKRIDRVDYIAIVDSDIELAHGWLEALLATVDWSRFSAACGRVHAADTGVHWAATLDEQGVRARFPGADREIDLPWRDVMYFNYLFKREVFERIGGFDPMFRTNAEDSDYFFRCSKSGLRFMYVHSAKAVHRYPPPSFGNYLRRQFRNGEYTIQFHLKQGTPLVLLKTMKALFFVSLTLTILGALAWPDRSLPFLGGAFALAGAFLGARMSFRPRLGGWIQIVGWLARGFGELKGWIRYYAFKGRSAAQSNTHPSEVDVPSSRDW